MANFARYCQSYGGCASLPCPFPLSYSPLLHLGKTVDTQEAHGTKVFFAVMATEFDPNITIERMWTGERPESLKY
jgi:hypothetical protein